MLAPSSGISGMNSALNFYQKKNLEKICPGLKRPSLDQKKKTKLSIQENLILEAQTLIDDL